MHARAHLSLRAPAPRLPAASLAPICSSRSPPANQQNPKSQLLPIIRITPAPTTISQVGADLQFQGPANQRRGRADAFSKILFQHAARHAPITLEDLMAAAAASAPKEDDFGSGGGARTSSEEEAPAVRGGGGEEAMAG